MIEQQGHAVWRGGLKELETEAEVPGVSESAFQEIAEQARKNCPVSKALSGVHIVLKSAKLTSLSAERA